MKLPNFEQGKRKYYTKYKLANVVKSAFEKLSKASQLSFTNNLEKGIKK